MYACTYIYMIRTYIFLSSLLQDGYRGREQYQYNEQQFHQQYNSRDNDFELYRNQDSNRNDNRNRRDDGRDR
jgi:hypothetical protein